MGKHSICRRTSPPPPPVSSSSFASRQRGGGRRSLRRQHATACLPGHLVALAKGISHPKSRSRHPPPRHSLSPSSPSLPPWPVLELTVARTLQPSTPASEPRRSSTVTSRSSLASHTTTRAPETPDHRRLQPPATEIAAVVLHLQAVPEPTLVATALVVSSGFHFPPFPPRFRAVAIDSTGARRDSPRELVAGEAPVIGPSIRGQHQLRLIA